MENKEFTILKPPAYVFFNQARDLKEQVIMQKNVGPVLERVELPAPDTAPQFNGMYLYYKDCPFPKKGFPYPEAMGAVNTVKRFSIIFTAFTTLRPLKLLEKLLFNISRFSDWVLNPHYLKEQYYSNIALTLWQLAARFLVNLGISEKVAYDSGRVFATLIEYDDAYQFRIGDLFSLTTQEKMLANPRKEIKKMMLALKERENGLKDDEVGGKFLSIGRMVRLFLLIPKVKKAFKKAFATINIKTLQLDDADRYWCLNRNDYEFFGEPLANRRQRYEKIHKDKTPDLVEVSLQFPNN